jgi:metal-dependent amidase/aminoacylase/carboxypeptidase family protein
MACGCTVEINTVPGYLPLANDRTLAGLFKENVEQLFGAGACCELPHSGGSTDAGDLSQIMPVLHPVMTGAAGTVHGKDWHIADPGAGYLAPAKALAMMAVDLLHDDAVLARRVQAEARPALTKDEYLVQQKAIFGTEVWRAEV